MSVSLQHVARPTSTSARLTAAATVGAAAAAAVNAAVHAWLLPEHLGAEMVEMGHAYVGALFAVAVPLLLGVAVALVLPAFAHLRPEVWAAGALLNGGMLLLLVASRLTSWLPAGYQEPWDRLSLVCVAAEAVFLAAFVLYRSSTERREVYR